MKKLFISAIIALMAISLGLYAQEKNATQEDPKMELQVVYEKTFTDPIVDVIFGEVEVTLDEAKRIGWKEDAFTEKKRTNERVKIFYPKVVITSRKEGIDYPGEPEGEMRAKEIKFYDKDGKLMKTVLAGHRLLRSENGRYLVVANLFGDGYDKQGKYIFHDGGGLIYNWNGDEIGQIPSGNIIQVSDKGYVLGEWIVYDSSGRKTGSLETDIPEEYMSCEVNCSKMSRNGEYIVTVLSMFGPKEALYILWDNTGRILWKKEFPFEVSGSMPLSHSIIENISIVGKAYTKSGVCIVMIDWDGKLLWNTKSTTGGNFRSKFSHDNKKVFIISSRGYVLCVDTFSGKIRWQHKADWSKMTIAINHQDKGYHYDKLLLLKTDEIIAARSLVGYRRPLASGVVFIDAETGKLLLEASQYQNVADLTTKNNFFFIIEKHKVTGNVIAWR
ncbi:PQQ-binding-like beta-propeller repeat protein [candidate division WOR-3 bacterium]|nr:PQQ-binding-like beta-propeller repeat protein [candidate division WOR-3 bacterium]